MKQSLLAGASSFAHLLGRGPKATKATEDEEEKKGKRAEELDEEKGDGDDEGDGPEDGKGKKAKRAESDDDDKEEERDEREERDEEEDDDDRKAKKAKGKRADDDSEEDEDEEGDDGSDGADMRKRNARAARLRERARCSAIFSDAAAGKNPALAAQLAFGTDLPRSSAIAVLRTGGLASRGRSLDDRMANVTVPKVGAGDPPPRTAGSPAVMTAAAIIEAGKKRRGEI